MTPTDVRGISYLRVPNEEEWPAEIRELKELFESKLGFVITSVYVAPEDRETRGRQHDRFHRKDSGQGR